MLKQICIGVNKIDWDTAGYKQERYDEISNEMGSMLIKVGWKQRFQRGEYVRASHFWLDGGHSVEEVGEHGVVEGVDAEEFHVDTLYDVLSLGILKIRGVGDVLTGRVEQGIVKAGEEAIFLPTHTPEVLHSGNEPSARWKLVWGRNWTTIWPRCTSSMSFACRQQFFFLFCVNLCCPLTETCTVFFSIRVGEVWINLCRRFLTSLHSFSEACFDKMRTVLGSTRRV